MQRLTMEGVNQLLYLQGVGLDYQNYHGENVRFNDEERLSVLKACGYNIEDEQAIAQANYSLDVKPWLALLPEQTWLKQGENAFTVNLDNVLVELELTWQISQGDDVIAQGSVELSSLAEVGNYHYQGKHYSKRCIDITKLALPIGYYQLSATVNTQKLPFQVSPHRSTIDGKATPTSLDNVQVSELIIYPEQVFQPLQQNIWGLSAQLYTLSSDKNFGLGDFNDLRELILTSAEQGADYILLNPLHALFEDDVERASPYSPSDRLAINPLYIHIQNCLDFQRSKTAQHLFEQLLVEANLAKSNEQYINYQTVFNCKYPIYFELFQQFVKYEKANDSERYQEFLVFEQQQNKRIKGYSAWLLDRKKLPEKYCNTDFITYLQWLAQSQLRECQQLAKTSGMAVGLIKDLAVGCNKDGYEFERNESLFSRNANIGAPPDPWSPTGQNWGLPAMDPVKVKQSGLQHFRQLIRANMQDCGALRIDHVMGLLRLWWCVESERQRQLSCYVYYPFEQMLATLSLESQLNQCAVIGEDLGVVPAEIKSALAHAQIYTNSVFYFSQTAWGEFIGLEYLPVHTLMMIANHDVAPFKSWWLASDLYLRDELNLFADSDQFIQAKQQRAQDKKNMLNWLNTYQSADAEYLCHEHLANSMNDLEIEKIYRVLALVL